jgi:hypothetical protein
MYSIYPSAAIVFAWLGEEQEGCDIPLAFNTAALIYDNIKSLHGSQRFDLSWIEAYPELYGCDETDEYFGPYHNRYWKNLDGLSNLQYWQRVWIVQESVLANTLFLICPTAGIDFSIVNTVAKWRIDIFHAVQIGALKKPGFFQTGAFGRLGSGSSHMRTMGLNRDIVFVPTSEDRENVPTPNEDTLVENEGPVRHHYWAISFQGWRYGTTDPRDHIYGLAGISNIGILPNYTKSVSDVYVEYVSVWLEYWREGGRMPEPFGSELWFLPMGGRSRWLHENQPPSWTPNSPSLSKERYSDFGIPRAMATTCDVFGEHFESSSITGLSLFVTGITVDEVSRLDDASKILERTLLEFFESYRLRPYPSGTPVSQVILMLYTWNLTDPGHIEHPRRQEIGKLLKTSSKKWSFVFYALAFVFRICHLRFQHDSAQSRDEPDWGHSIVDTMSLLGLSRNRWETEKEIAAEILLFLLRNSGKEYDYADITELEGFVIPRVIYFLSRRKIGRRDVEFLPIYLQMAATLKRMETQRPVLFQTRDGYLGLSRPGVREGDMVCVLKGCTIPMILRREGECCVSVGPTNVVGLMNGEARELVEAGKVTPERFGIR